MSLAMNEIALTPMEVVEDRQQGHHRCSSTSANMTTPQDADKRITPRNNNNNNNDINVDPERNADGGDNDNNDNHNDDDDDNDLSSSSSSPLPSNRFELELEFVQSLASPAYLHFLATYREGDGPVLLHDPQFVQYLQYLMDTWSQPQYARFLAYPHCLYFLNLLLTQPLASKEWALPAYRNFCHQQQFLAWQHRHSTLYGKSNS